jgi:hypothetical protein
MNAIHPTDSFSSHPRVCGGGCRLFSCWQPVLERNRSAPLRLPILSKYKDLGTIIEGKVEQGTVSVGDKLFVMPNRTPVEVMNVWLDQVRGATSCLRHLRDGWLSDKGVNRAHTRFAHTRFPAPGPLRAI